MELMPKNPKFFKCFVTHITTTDKDVEIWCQTDAKIGSRVQLCIDMNHKTLSDLFAINSQNLRPIPTPEVGQNYLTRIKNDLHFYRTVVTHVKPETSLASVLLIDFGIEEWVPFNHLVEFESLFQIKPLAQKFFLADIQTKDNEWDTEDVKRCLEPCLMFTFQCEVIGVNKNTECIRVYDQFFRQPIVQKLVQQCNGCLHYPNVGKEIYEAIDLTIADKYPNKQIEGRHTTDYSKTNGCSSVESSPKVKLSIKQNSTIEDIEDDLTPIKTESQQINGHFKPEVVSNQMVSNESQNLEIKDCVDYSFVRSSDGMSQMTSMFTSLNVSFGTVNPSVESMPVLNNGYPKYSPPEESESIQTKVQMSAQKIDNQIQDSIAVESQSEIVTQTNETPSEVVTQTNETPSEVVTQTNETPSEVVTQTNETPPEVVTQTNETQSEVVTQTNETQSEVVTQTNETQPQVLTEPNENQSGVLSEPTETLLIVNNKCDAIPQQMPAIEVVKEEANKKKSNEEPNVCCGDVCDPIVGENKLIGKTLKIYATASIKEGSFYCQLTEKFEEITSLIDRMTEFYNQIYETNKNGLNVNELKLGDIVAARFTEDQLWYRASVKAIDNNRLTLFYIDFGNEETVDIKECKQLDPQFNLAFMEPQAIYCSITGRVPSVDTIVKSVLDLIEMECLFTHCENNVYSIELVADKSH